MTPSRLETFPAARPPWPQLLPGLPLLLPARHAELRAHVPYKDLEEGHGARGSQQRQMQGNIGHPRPITAKVLNNPLKHFKTF